MMKIISCVILVVINYLFLDQIKDIMSYQTTKTIHCSKQVN